MNALKFLILAIIFTFGLAIPLFVWLSNVDPHFFDSGFGFLAALNILMGFVNIYLAINAGLEYGWRK